MPLSRTSLMVLALLGLLASISAMPMYRGRGRPLGGKYNNMGKGHGRETAGRSEAADTYIIVEKDSHGHYGKRSTMGKCESFLHSTMMNQGKTGSGIEKVAKVMNYSYVGIGFVAEMNEAAVDMVSKCTIIIIIKGLVHKTL